MGVRQHKAAKKRKNKVVGVDEEDMKEPCSTQVRCRVVLETRRGLCAKFLYDFFSVLVLAINENCLNDGCVTKLLKC